MQCVLLAAYTYMRFMLHKFKGSFDIFFHGLQKQREVQDSNFSYNITEDNRINFYS
jgi:hypothetical protein